MTSTLGKQLSAPGRFAILIGILFFFAAQAGAEGQKKLLLGLDGGWSLGRGEGSSGLHHEIITFNYHLGGKLQLGLTKSAGLEFKLSYQAFTHKSDRRTSAVKPENWVAERLGLFTLGMNGIFYSKQANRSQFYLLAGGGACTVSLDEDRSDAIRVILTAGFGMRIFLAAALRSAINFGITFNSVLNSKKFFRTDANLSYFQLGIGYEFYPRHN